MKEFLIVIQILASIALVILILMQAKGTGFGRSWGSGGSSFTRRGLEKLVFKLTFVVSAIFLLVSLINILI
jgi:preprotein translocase subunit SecG